MTAPAPGGSGRRAALRWARGRAAARLKDGRRRPAAAAAPQAPLGPAAAAPAARRLPPPYHEAAESPHAGLDLLGAAPRDCVAVLGVRHLCIDSGCATTAKEGIPTQNLRMNENL